MESVVALGIFALISTALFSLFFVGLRVVNEDKARIGARTIAEEHMEILRNLPYDEIGTVGGVPAGEIETEEEITLNNITYDVETDIRYVDDDYDDVAPTDLVNVDYKQIRISISWNSQVDAEPLTLVSNIVPRGMESLEGGGTLWIEAHDSTPNPIANATVQIINNEVTPTVSINSQTNDDGIYILPGALVATQSYEVLVTKSGYSTGQTYTLDPINNPNPDPAHLSVGESEVTNKIFIIDLLSDLSIHAQDYDTGDPIDDFTFTLQGDDTIGTDGEGMPIYKYDEEHITAGGGDVSLTDLDPDTYIVSFDGATTGYDLAGSNPLLPYLLTPDDSVAMTLYLAPHASNTLLVTVLDADGEAVPEPSVRLYNTEISYDETVVGSLQGQSFFTPLDLDVYDLEVTKDGYEIYELEVNVEGQSSQEIALSAT